ncbi:hypothetical protein BC628DRAFT_1379556 [Trametes gibbosa]|nr:hypothetical protein BC628DRAFT_1379556 [Trametes gibbosa]
MALCDSFISGGTYILLNAKGGTALDMTSSLKVEGHHLHSKSNQRWRFINTGDGWAIQNCQLSKDGQSVYLSANGGPLKEGKPLVGSTISMSWYVYLVDGALRITWPRTDYVMDLSDWGNSAPGTHVQLMRLKKEQPCQLWYFSRCGTIDTLAPTTTLMALTPPPLEILHKERSQFQNAPVLHVLLHMHDEMALELDRTCTTSIRHRPSHKEQSQQWRLLPCADGETIQACRESLDGQPLYLTVRGLAQRGACVVASPYPVTWRVERCQPTGKKLAIRSVLGYFPSLCMRHLLTSARYSIFWPKTNLVITSQKAQGDVDDVTLAECDDTSFSKWNMVIV